MEIIFSSMPQVECPPSTTSRSWSMKFSTLRFSPHFFSSSFLTTLYLPFSTYWLCLFESVSCADTTAGVGALRLFGSPSLLLARCPPPPPPPPPTPPPTPHYPSPPPPPPSSPSSAAALKCSPSSGRRTP